MSAVTRPRGPLPRRVYWFRRLLVLAVACALVVGIARLLGSSGGSSADQANQVAATRPSGTVGATPTPSPAATGGPTADAAKVAERRSREERRERRRKLPQPDGPCLDSDVVVTPVVRTQPAGQQVRVVLHVGTLESPACFWEVSPDRVFVNISSRRLGLLWTTQHCSDAVPTEEVVARQEQPARVAFLWSGRESDEECTDGGPWVTSGRYEIAAAARGSTHPRESLFVLGEGVAPTITVTPTPTPTAEAEPTDEAEPTGEPGRRDRRSRPQT